MASDGSDLTRWNVARSLAGDILAAVADDDHRSDAEIGNENPYDYTSLLDDYPDRQLPSEEALRAGVGVVLCAVDAPHLDLSMSDERDPTTRSQGATFALVDDRPFPSDNEEGNDDTPLWSQAVNLLAQWLMSSQSQVHVGGKVRHRLNSWNEARHLATRFVAVDVGDMTYEEATQEWSNVDFPPEKTSLTVVHKAESATDDKQHCIDEVARWIKSLDWLKRDKRDSKRIAMGSSGNGMRVAETPSMVLKQTDQLTLSGDVKENVPQMLGQTTEKNADVTCADNENGIENSDKNVSNGDGTG